jgi:ribosomal protein S13
MRVLEGIGYKSNEVMEQIKLKNLKQLDDMSEEKLEAILDVLMEAESK